MKASTTVSSPPQICDTLSRFPLLPFQGHSPLYSPCRLMFVAIPLFFGSFASHIASLGRHCLHAYMYKISDMRCQQRLPVAFPQKHR